MGRAGTARKVEGVHAVAAAAIAGRVTRLTVEAARAEDSDVAALITAVERSGGAVSIVDRIGELATTDAPQGVVAEAEPLPEVSVRQLAAVSAAFVVVLDHLEDPRNVGAVARSALAAGCTGLVRASRRAAPLTAAAFKAAAGALETLPVAVVSSIPKALDELRAGGLWIVGLAGEADQELFGLSLLREPVAIVVGAEGAGLARLSRDKADVLASIPMVGGVESLNASAAATVACFEVARIRAEVT